MKKLLCMFLTSFSITMFIFLPLVTYIIFDRTKMYFGDGYSSIMIITGVSVWIINTIFLLSMIDILNLDSIKNGEKRND